MPELVVTPTFQAVMDAVRAGRHVFVTGRAGTGKSTLLSLIRQLDLGKTSAVVAPTGVAALNVEGETIHNLFGFRPSLSPDLREYRPPLHLADLDLLIVDEISMARADLVDMMDTALRRRRDSAKPFGGVQLVMVGDLYQLPPVVTPDDEALVLSGYSSPFFFAAKALRRLDLTTFELDEVFRQHDDEFIALLNAIRDGTVTDEQLDALNARVDPDCAEQHMEGQITLTTTNKAADAVNRARLQRLGNPVLTSTAKVTGDFDPSLYKAESRLAFAVGAQVMMLVNGAEYVNGSLGRIVDIDRQGGSLVVKVELTESGQTVEVAPYRWEITRPVRRDGQVSREVVGSFTQLPFRLAWAVTVHKSQGKTFDRVVFDRGRSVFAAGQLYVALSRCTTLEGLTLTRPVRRRDVITDPDVKRFHRKALTPPVPQAQTQRSYLGYVSTGGGDYDKLVEIALIRETTAGDEVIITSLVNPLRDVTDARETGIVASHVAAAPTIDELRGYLAALLTETVVVTDRLTDLERMVGFEDAAIDAGLGIDLREHELDIDQDQDDSALDRARRVQRAAATLSSKRLRTAPLQVDDAPIAPGAYLLPRHHDVDLRPLAAFITQLEATPKQQLRLLLGLVPAAPGQAELALERAHKVANDAGIPAASVESAADQLLDRLQDAVKRNATLTAAERRLIEQVSAALDRPIDTTTVPCQQTAFVLEPGMRVCFTGSPPARSQDAHLTKSELRAAAQRAGLVEVGSVTKTKCDVLVAYDTSSMSGKAKKAREFGKPILSAAEFLQQLNR